MKKFAFRLESVLQLKEQLVRQSQRRLAAIADQQRQCEAELLALRQELQQLAPSSDRADWHVKLRYGKMLELRLAAKIDQRQALRTDWLAERVVYQQTDQEAESLRKLREKQQKEHAYEMARLESADIEEHVLRGWMQGEVRT